ncbi:activator of the mannose operon, transcriptional antiterminator [Propionispira arboris]|uniref:Activator of the mannose operon, transcriptional antiterminator n=1 Tax=Propionispira arboris TaxID=84035 RepID=A0A1H6Z5C6_9FIRM|nr:transcription antiterminator [Propionispira arboris]SEJ47906.1 activator of the mannose operon, transcriptional antiterminator [Propionispira arboris]
MVQEFLSTREKKILTALLKVNGYLTSIELSEILNVSDKTIHRDLQSIRYKFGCQSIVQYKRGKGYCIDPISDINTVLGLSKQQAGFFGIDVEMRRRNIMILLLLQAPIETSINKLAEIYFISNASIVNDLSIIEAELKQYSLSLVRSHNGTHIDGSEYNIRNLLMQMFNQFPMNSAQPLLYENTDTAMDHDLYTFFSHKDISFVKLLLDRVEQILCGKIKDPYYINIFTHVLILIKRLENNEHTVNKGNDENGNYKDKVIFNCTSMVVQEIGKYMNHTIPTNEFFYIYQYFYSSRIDPENDNNPLKLEENNDEEKGFVKDLLKRVSTEVKNDFSNDFSLQQALLLHIRPLTKRIESKIFISNPLKDDIKRDFPQVFKAVKQALEKQNLKLAFRNLSDNEISYIVVYFQSALEKKAQQKRVVIVCSSGVGTSHLLAARVKRTFPDWKIVDIVSASRVQKFSPHQVDIILTTVKLEKQNIPSILVSSIFNTIDAVKVKQALNLI